MTRARIYRGIGLLATLTVALMGPQSVASEQISTKQELSNNLPEVVASPQAKLANENSHQRRELSWWSFALFFAHGPICPPGKPGEKCREDKAKHHHHSHSSSSGSGGSGSGSSGSSGGSSYSGGGGGGGGGGGNNYDGNGGGDGGGGNNYNGYNGDGNGVDENGREYEADGDYNSEYLWNGDSYEDGSSFSESGSAEFVAPGSKGFFLLLVVAAAVATAIAAMVVGSRRDEEKEYHPLRGAVEKRMKLFGGFADRCFEDRAMCGSQADAGDLEISSKKSLNVV